MAPKVTIVMPNYNSGELLDVAVRSVVGQTFDDWQLIIVDDGSTDGSWNRIKEWKLSHGPKLVVTGRAMNSGSPVAPRNEALQFARSIGSKYVAFLDSDDWWHKNKLKYQVAYMDNSDVALTYHNMELVSGQETWAIRSQPYEGWCFNRLLMKNFIANSSVMVRSDVLMEQHYWHSRAFKISHDWDLWLRIARKYRIGYLPSVLGGVTERSGSVTTNVRRRRKESREVIRRWKGLVPMGLYYRALLPYYFVELRDLLWLR